MPLFRLYCTLILRSILSRVEVAGTIAQKQSLQDREVTHGMIIKLNDGNKQTWCIDILDD